MGIVKTTGAWALALAIATPSLGETTNDRHVRGFSGADGRCMVSVDGERMSIEDLRVRAKDWRDKERPVHIDSGPEIAWRCIGSIIFSLQDAGVRKIGFISEPPPAAILIAIPKRRCRPSINGKSVTLESLRASAKKWHDEQPEIRFVPDARAKYDCVDAVLGILRESKVGNLGFVGNEAFEEPSTQ